MMYPDGPETDKLKETFAAAYLRNPTDPYAAAKTFEGHPGKAAWISQNWIYDPFVVDTMSKMQQTLGPVSMLPSKEEFALQVLAEATKVEDKSDKLKYFDLFAKVMGYVDKPGSGGLNIGTLNMNKVMTRVVYESEGAFERAAIARQAKLVEHAAS